MGHTPKRPSCVRDAAEQAGAEGKKRHRALDAGGAAGTPSRGAVQKRRSFGASPEAHAK